MENYRLREEAEADLERIWFYGETIEIMAVIGQQDTSEWL